MLTFIYFLAIVLFMILCMFLCLIILIQEGKGGGLGASFGGEARDSVFGTSTAEVLKKFTGWLAFVFFVSCIVLSLWTSAMARTRSNANVPEFTIESPQA